MDRQFLQKMQAKDPAGLEGLMDAYGAYVCAIVSAILGQTMTPEDGEEVVSDVFLAAWNHAGDIRPGKAKAWLGAVARNKAKNKLRKAGKALPLEEDILELEGESPFERMEREQRRQLVREAIDSLGEPDREIFLRHYYSIQTVSQISRQMGIQESTVKSKLARGRKKLKTKLEGGEWQ